MEETSSLLIYEEVPEKTTLYVIPNSVLNCNPDIRKALEGSHGKFINSDDSTLDMEELSLAVSETGILAEYKVEADKPLKGTFTHVYLTGFIL